MSQHWDEFAKSLADPVPRRESLRRLGAVMAGALLAPLGMDSAFAGKRQPDPCKTFCKCKNKKQQTACLNACKACQGNTSRICGSCGSYVCCGNGQACCNGACTDLGEDVSNCGACGNVCASPGPYEYAGCIIGQCNYWCVEGAIYCDGACTAVDWDRDNCGACGNVCAEPGPNEYSWCEYGQCEYACYEGMSPCDVGCADLNWDADNCGACGNVCGGATPYCVWGQCTDCEGAGGMMCGGACIDVMWDGLNCGACGNVCPPQSACAWGVCEGLCIGCY